MGDKSAFRADIIRRNLEQWSVRLLRKDLEELRREQAHLRRKLGERTLTDWEVHRITQISREILELLQHFNGVKAS